MPVPPPRQHLVVVGADTTAVRLVEELVRTGEEVVVLAPGGGDPGAVADVEALGARVVAAPRRVGEADLRAVGVPGARAVVLLGDDDVGALRLALVVEELAPEVRLVIEMANPRLGTTLTELIGDVTLLSPAELAGPAFVAAALATADTQAFEIGGRMVAAGPRERVTGEELAVLANSRLTGIEAVLPAGPGDVVLGTALVAPPRSDARRSGVPGALARVFDRRARVVVVGIVVLVLLSTLYFHAGGSSWLVSLYRALTTSTDTGDGDLGDLSVPFRFGAVAIQLFGLVLSAGITAVIVDALVSARLAAITGGVRGRPRRHVVVCGLGRVGTAVAAQLKARGVPVVAVERSEDVPGVLEARRLRIPVVIGPASDAAAQAVAGIARAVAVVAVTDDEAVNLEIALVARDVNPRVRVVTRMFDHELAARVERRLELGTTRSVSMLAAPAFAAAALGRRREVIFPVGRRVLLFTEVTVHAGSAAPGRSLCSLAEEGVSRLLAVAPAGGGWDWRWADRPVEAGDRLAVVATRAGLARMLRATKAVRPPAGTPGT
ncbi:NAD-binding protein [Microlunatus capsulatus]|uniref:Trk K+ transport system NAD-binding subunit n=1 Tax=Microlunatus capsulatus TaxID=99117 RepID=A0ABS4Z3N7_9ACTN|nr:NAD-binding protein [Microlunatus capsulatus]MBP2415609.1 Trk K+ transport system NAD-binding subunit [Microlunatus capsulatus]